MKDILKRITIGAIMWSLIWYLLFLLLNNTTVIVQTEFINFNILYYILLFAIFFGIFVFFGIYPRHFKLTKATLFVVGLALIIVGDTVLINDVAKHIYIGDICKLTWTVLALLAWTNVLITDKVKKIKENSKIEIIEV